jgi:hypothetical protein
MKKLLAVIVFLAASGTALAGDTEESKAINAAFDEMLDCEKNRLYESTKH